LRRLAWSLLDQGSSSIANLALSVLLAQLLSRADFGAFAIVFSAYLVALGVNRAAVGEPTLLRLRRFLVGKEHLSAERVATQSASLLLAAMMAIAFCGSAAVIGGVVGELLFILAAALPGLLFLDCNRYVLYALSDAQRASQLGAITTVMQFGALSFAIGIGVREVAHLFAVWAGVATAVSCVVCLLHRRLPSLVAGVHWLRRNRDVAPHYLLEYGILASVQQGLVLIVGVTAGLSATAELRAVQVLLGPVNMVSMGVAIVALPAAARRVVQNANSLRRLSLQVSAFLSFAMLVTTIAALLIPDSLGRRILGASWPTNDSTILLVSAGLVLNLAAYGATLGLRALGKSASTLKARLVLAPGALGCIAGGAATGGLQGALIANLVVAALQAGVWWYMYQRATTAHEAWSPKQASS
jgi:O-antigen/teichoic acid export membrane protein